MSLAVRNPRPLTQALGRALAAGAGQMFVDAWELTFYPAQGSAVGTENPPNTLTLRGDGTNAAIAEYAVATKVGATYRLRDTVAGEAPLLVIGNSQGVGDIVDYETEPVGQNSRDFVATATTTYIRFYNQADADAVISALSLKRVG